MQVLYAAWEAAPFLKTGGLGDVAGALPAALQAEACDIRVILPKHGSIPAELLKELKPVADFYFDLSWRRQYCGIEELIYHDVHYYFVDNQ
ncbi:MAG: glycogen/starch synthase, partial [Evtepia sp.]